MTKYLLRWQCWYNKLAIRGNNIWLHRMRLSTKYRIAKLDTQCMISMYYPLLSCVPNSSTLLSTILPLYNIHLQPSHNIEILPSWQGSIPHHSWKTRPIGFCLYILISLWFCLLTICLITSLVLWISLYRPNSLSYSSQIIDCWALYYSLDMCIMCLAITSYRSSFLS